MSLIEKYALRSPQGMANDTKQLQDAEKTKLLWPDGPENSFQLARTAGPTRTAGKRNARLLNTRHQRRWRTQQATQALPTIEQISKDRQKENQKDKKT